jgi:hypothetical protein
MIFARADFVNVCRIHTHGFANVRIVLLPRVLKVDRDQAFPTQALSVTPVRGMYQRNRLLGARQFGGFAAQRIRAPVNR